MSVQVKLLGGFGVARDDVPVAADVWGRRQAAQLVQFLALTPRPAAAPRTGDRRLVARADLGRRRASAAQGGPLRSPRTGRPGRRRPACRSWWDCSRVATTSRSTSASSPGPPDGPCGPATRRSQPRRWSGTAVRCCPRTPTRRGATSRDGLRTQQHLDLLRLLGRWDDVLAEEPTDEAAHLAVARAHAAGGDVRGALSSSNGSSRLCTGSSVPLRARRPCGFAGSSSGALTRPGDGPRAGPLRRPGRPLDSSGGVAWGSGSAPSFTRRARGGA